MENSQLSIIYEAAQSLQDRLRELQSQLTFLYNTAAEIKRFTVDLANQLDNPNNTQEK